MHVCQRSSIQTFLFTINESQLVDALDELILVKVYFGDVLELLNIWSKHIVNLLTIQFIDFQIIVHGCH